MERKKWLLTMLMLPFLLGSMLMLAVGCEDPQFDEPIEPDQEEPMDVPDEGDLDF